MCCDGQKDGPQNLHQQRVQLIVCLHCVHAWYPVTPNTGGENTMFFLHRFGELTETQLL